MTEPLAAEIDFAGLMPEVARRLLGDPNKALSNGKEQRHGTHGSKSINIEKGPTSTMRRAVAAAPSTSSSTSWALARQMLSNGFATRG